MAAPSTSAPPVVAVVVAHNPGTWFNEALEHLAAQRYDSLAVLVIDAASDRDLTEQIHDIIPSAAVHRLDDNPGYGAAANNVEGLVSGAAFYLFLHDDVALAPDAVPRLVEESYRSNAGVAGPKLLDWNDPRLIRSVGNAIDKAGVYAPYAEPGELDQEQHDRVRDVFSVQGGCILIRADLFESLGGFDPGIDFLGDDLDLCWRAHVVGARVLIAPVATARHLEATSERGIADERRKRLARHRIRTMAKCYGWLDLLLVLPQAFLMTLAEAMFAVVTGRFRHARDVMGGWLWNVPRLPAIVSSRRRLKRLRRVRDRDIRRLQVRGSARLTAFVRGQIGEGTGFKDLTARGRDLAGTLSTGPRRLALVVWGVLGIAFVFGARHLITRGIVPIGQFADLPSRGSLLHAFTSGWSEAEFGASGAAPAGLGLLGLAATFFLGATGLLRQILILGLMPLGWIGAWRLSGPLGSRRGRLVAAVVYAAIPLPYDAMAQGRWDLLLMYGSMPWIVLRLARLIGVAPYGDLKGEAGPGIPVRSLLHQVVALALVVAVVASFEPFVVLMVPVIAVVMVVASGLTGSLWSPLRAVLLSLLASALAALMHLPWLLRFRNDWMELWEVVVGRHRGGPSSFVDLVRFDLGQFGNSQLLWGLVVVASLSLILGRDWRAAWAPRAWSIALVSFAAAWLAGNEILPFDLPDAGILLVPGAVGLAWAAGIGFAAFEYDVARFAAIGRRLALGIGVVALGAAVIPAVGATTEGDYGMPRSDISGALRFIDRRPELGSFRVMWLGDGQLLPTQGRAVGNGLSVSTSTDGPPDVRSAWLGPSSQAVRSMVDTIEVALNGDTARLGRLLAPFGVKYIVVPLALAPAFADAEVSEGDPLVLQTLATQIDLSEIGTDSSVVVYENIAWHPIRSGLDRRDASASSETNLAALAGIPTAVYTPVLTTRERSTLFSGDLETQLVVVAIAEPDRWRLEVDGKGVSSEPAFGWSAGYDVTSPGAGQLIFNGRAWQGWWLLGQFVGWVLILNISFSEVRRRRSQDSPTRENSAAEAAS